MLLGILMVAIFPFGGFCSVTNLEVEYGATVFLPCDGSAYVEEQKVNGTGPGEEEQGLFCWEALGEDVVSFENGELLEGPLYQGRVRLAPEESIRMGNWSLQLERVMLTDASMYECVLLGRRVVSTVWLKVKSPVPEQSVQAWLGDATLLSCFVEVPEDDTDLHVWWMKNGSVVHSLPHVEEATQDGNQTEDEDLARFTLWPDRKSNHFGLIISPVLIQDHGEYHCFYRNSSNEDPMPGFPETVRLSVLGTEPTDHHVQQLETEMTTEMTTLVVTVPAASSETGAVTQTEVMENVTGTVLFSEATTENMTEAWSGAYAWRLMEMETRTTGESQTVTTDSPPDPTLLEEATQPQPVATTSDPAEPLEETATILPVDVKEGINSIQWETLPWVRIGIISGALALATVTLCILGAVHMI